MSKRRASKRSRKGKVPAHLRKYLFKKKRRSKRRSYKMAKRRRKRSHRRTHHRRRRSYGRRRRSGGGGRSRWMPAREDLHLYAAGGAIGWLETAASADANHVLNKIPRPVAQLGYTGGTALAAWVVTALTGNRWARLIARAAATVATYQIGRHGGMFADASKAVTMQGDDYLSGDEHLIDEAMMGALDAEGEMVGDDPMIGGIPWEGNVVDADAGV